SPSSATSQPMMSSECGQVYSPPMPRAGPSPADDTIAAAAPSPKSAVATMLLFDTSLFRKESAQSSTTSSNIRDRGAARARSAARASPSTPPAQPSPNSG